MIYLLWATDTLVFFISLHAIATSAEGNKKSALLERALFDTAFIRIYTDTFRNAILFTGTSTILGTTKFII